MTDLELIFSMLGEAATKEIAVNQNAQGFDENKIAAKTGGRIAGDARHHLEQESGKPVISKDNWIGVRNNRGGMVGEYAAENPQTAQLSTDELRS